MKTGGDNYGQPQVADPVEIMVRWENKRDESISAKGEPIGIDATVQLGQRVYPGDLMWLGAMSDWVGTGSDNQDNEIMQVDSYDEIPDIKGRTSSPLRIAKLVLFKGTLPDVLS
jgi:hypothetical protein